MLISLYVPNVFRPHLKLTIYIYGKKLNTSDLRSRSAPGKQNVKSGNHKNNHNFSVTPFIGVGGKKKNSANNI